MEGRRDRKMGIRSGGGGVIAFLPPPPSPPFATHGPAGDLRACGEGGRRKRARGG